MYTFLTFFNITMKYRLLKFIEEKIESINIGDEFEAVGVNLTVSNGEKISIKWLIDNSYISEVKEETEEEKIPYTIETFPVWAVWIKRIGFNNRAIISSVNIMSVDFLDGSEFYSAKYNIINDIYEISGADGIWKPFYQTEE